MTEGVSTFVYRIRRQAETFYLRVLPEVDASFAPEARVHEILRARGVHVPEVVYFEHFNDVLERSVMVTTEIRGCHVGRRAADGATRQVLVEAGRQLAVINSVPVTGFGWIRRDRCDVAELGAEHRTYRAFATEHLAEDLATLEREVLAGHEIRAIVDAHHGWLEGEQALLAHGDFDVTPIFQEDGCYTGIIDFGEIRGADRWYDLGHFRMHDGGTLPALMLDSVLDGYREVTPLPPEAFRRICFVSLLIAIRALARHLRKRGLAGRPHQALTSIPRDIAVLTS